MKTECAAISYHQTDFPDFKALRVALGKQTIITVEMHRSVFFGQKIWQAPTVKFHPFTTQDPSQLSLYSMAISGAQQIIQNFEQIREHEMPAPPSSVGTKTIQIKRS